MYVVNTLLSKHWCGVMVLQLVLKKKIFMSSLISFLSNIMLCVWLCLFFGGQSQQTDRAGTHGTQGFRWIQRWMFYFWIEQTMFEVIHWMLQFCFVPPLIPHRPWVHIYHDCHNVSSCQIKSRRQKGGNKDRKRGRRRERMSIDCSTSLRWALT